jgi:hypothetical protein
MQRSSLFKVLKHLTNLCVVLLFFAYSSFGVAAITPPHQTTITAAPGTTWGVSGGTVTKDFAGCPMTEFIGTGNTWLVSGEEVSRSGNWGTLTLGTTTVPATPFGFMGPLVGLLDGCSNPSGWVAGGSIPADASPGATASFRVRNKTAFVRAFHDPNLRMNELSSFVITIVVGHSNSAPVAINSSLSLLEDTAGAVALKATDADGDALTYSIVTAPNSAHGTVTISGSRATFTPRTNWNGTSSFTFRAMDPKGEVSNIGTVTLTVTPVNDPPSGVAAVLNTNEDIPAGINLLVEDPDIPYGDTHIFEIVSQPSGGAGAAAISGNRLTYTPAANWNGSASLTYRVRDSAGVWSAPATVTINVAAVNDAPVAQAKAFSTPEDIVGSVTLSATDIDSPVPSVFQIVTAPNAAHGTASISGNVLTFTPAANWSGVATLTYRAQDSAGAWSAPVPVTITVTPVNDPPVAVAKTLNIAEDTTGSVVLGVVDPDIPYGDTHTYQIAGVSQFGDATISGSTLTFTPDPDWNGSTSVTYRVRDAAGVWSAPATVTITVSPVNDKPVAQAKTLSTPEDTVGQVTLTATDIDSPVPVVFQLVGAVPATQGAAVISGNKLTFTPALNWHGVISLSYRAQDTAGAWSDAVPISVTVAAVNDVPMPTGKVPVIKTIENRAASVKLTVGQ